MRVYAFQGTRYSVKAGDPSLLAAPPFDQIDDALRDRLHRTPHQFSHLSRPVSGSGDDAYRWAASLHQQWLRQGLVREDDRPALYPYEIELAGGGHRLGLCALIGLEPAAAGIIRPHEQTLAKAIGDRLRLLQATGVDLEPILLLSDDGGTLDRLLAGDVERSVPLAEHRDADGHRHRLYRVEDQDRIGRYRELLAPVSGLIADGHHRYKVAQIYADETGARAGTAACKLAVITSLASPGLAIDPIHRALRLEFDPARLLPLTRSRRPCESEGGGALAAEVAAAPQPALGAWPAGGRPEIWLLDPGKGPAELRPEASRLPVVLLHRALLPRLGLSEAAGSDGTVVYRSDPAALELGVRTGAATVGFWLPPMPPDLFAAAIADGDLLPPKSTRFLPKVASGLVWARHQSRLG